MLIGIAFLVVVSALIIYALAVAFFGEGERGPEGGGIPEGTSHSVFKWIFIALFVVVLLGIFASK